jgi:hypothetical protein
LKAATQYLVPLSALVLLASCTDGDQAPGSTTAGQQADSGTDGTVAANESDGPVSPYPLHLEATAADFHVMLTCAPYEAPTDAAELWWGGGQAPPQTVVTRLSVVRGGDPLPVTRTFYADLANVRALQAVMKEGRLYIQFEGGDAADAYFGEITCDEAGMPVRRRVSYAEFPEYDYDTYERVLKEIPEP